MTLAVWCSKCGAELGSSVLDPKFADDLAEIVHLREELGRLRMIIDDAGNTATADTQVLNRLKAIVDLVKQVRVAQKKFFKTKDRNDLVACKQLESQLDNLLANG